MLPGIVSKEMSLHSQLAVHKLDMPLYKLVSQDLNGYLAVISGSKVL